MEGLIAHAVTSLWMRARDVSSSGTRKSISLDYGRKEEEVSATEENISWPQASVHKNKEREEDGRRAEVQYRVGAQWVMIARTVMHSDTIMKEMYEERSYAGSRDGARWWRGLEREAQV